MVTLPLPLDIFLPQEKRTLVTLVKCAESSDLSREVFMPVQEIGQRERLIKVPNMLGLGLQIPKKKKNLLVVQVKLQFLSGSQFPLRSSSSFALSLAPAQHILWAHQGETEPFIVGKLFSLSLASEPQPGSSLSEACHPHLFAFLALLAQRTLLPCSSCYVPS